jgi:antitoxin component YwqK of YwqJK toxin-antitoxin module
MKRRLGLFGLAFLIAICGCDPAAVQYPPGSAQYPYPNSNTPSPAPQPPEISGSQRWQHAWSKALEGVVMGGSIGGPYGAGGGLIIGLITGLITAESHYGQMNNQIYTEQKKDQQLEAAIEQELARQRDLENQVASATTTPAGGEPAAQPVSAAAPPSQTQKPLSAQPPAETPPRATVSQNKSSDNLASLSKPPSNQTAPSPFKNVEVRDINGDGVPDLWIYYNPQKPGEVIRQEEATKGDGRVDTWSYFKDGKMVRREIDTKQIGRPDTIYFYDNDKLVREDRDETGQGTMTYRAIYQNGRLAKVEKDTSASGRADLWIYYDASTDGEIVLKEERDLNGDGIADLWSYYENGRLIRRDVSAAGLEILSKKEQLPAPVTEITKISLPGS